MPWLALMHLVSPEPSHIAQLQSWFPSTEEILAWGGPGMTYPSELELFKQQLKLETLASFALLDRGQLAGFGQYYERLRYCHLGRLAINPRRRNQGLGQTLITLLRERGEAEFRPKGSSLFVMSANQPAIQAYLKAGFSETAYPEPMPIDNCLYMTASALHRAGQAH